MGRVFQENEFPQHLYKAGVPAGLYVSDKIQLKQALADGFSPIYIPQEYPKWVGPPDFPEPVLTRAGDAAGMRMEDTGQVRLVSRGGKICANAAEEKAHLALLASRAEQPAQPEKRGPGRPPNPKPEVAPSAIADPVQTGQTAPASF